MGTILMYLLLEWADFSRFNRTAVYDCTGPTETLVLKAKRRTLTIEQKGSVFEGSVSIAELDRSPKGVVTVLANGFENFDELGENKIRITLAILRAQERGTILIPGAKFRDARYTCWLR